MRKCGNNLRLGRQNRLPGVMTTFNSRSIRSNICQLVRPLGRFHPDIRRVYATVNIKTGGRRGARAESLRYPCNDRSSARICCRPSGDIKCFCAALHRITHAVRFGAPAPMPKRMQRKFAAVSGPREQRFWHDRKPTTHACETAVLGKTAKFDCAFARARNFVNRVRNLWIGDVRLHRLRRTEGSPRAPARNRPTAQVVRAMQPRRSDYSGNKDKQDRHVLPAVRERIRSRPCTADKDPS